MLFVVHAVDKTDMLPTRAKFYRAHRVHLDGAVNYDVDVVTAGTLVADDGETPVGSIFITRSEARRSPVGGRRDRELGRRLHGKVKSAAGRRRGARACPLLSALICAAPPRLRPATRSRSTKRGLVLAVFNLDGEFFVTDDACTHGPGSLSEGFIEGEVVECNFHNGQFNIKTGEVVAAPCMVPVKIYKTIVENDRVFIEAE